MHIVVTKFIEGFKKESRHYTKTPKGLESNGLLLDVDPDSVAEEPHKFTLSWQQTPGFSTDLMYVTLLILFTLGKGVDYSALMERIGAALRKKEKYSEDFPEWFLFSWQDKGRWFIQITKR